MDIAERIRRQNAEFDAVVKLAQTYNRLPAPVDDDYPEMRHYYESSMQQLIAALRLNRPDVFILPSRRVDSPHIDAALLDELHREVDDELGRACKWPPMNSAHEGYGVLAEEFAELFDHVRLKQSKRDMGAMRTEAIQVAAMAMRFAHDVCNETRGRK